MKLRGHMTKLGNCKFLTVSEMKHKNCTIFNESINYRLQRHSLDGLKKNILDKELNGSKRNIIAYPQKKLEIDLPELDRSLPLPSGCKAEVESRKEQLNS